MPGLTSSMLNTGVCAMGAASIAPSRRHAQSEIVRNM
jgi:hypothetical protein